jgi:hypothetical protein
MATLSAAGSFLALGAAHIASLILGRSDVTQGAERDEASSLASVAS